MLPSIILLGFVFNSFIQLLIEKEKKLNNLLSKLIKVKQ